MKKFDNMHHMLKKYSRGIFRNKFLLSIEDILIVDTQQKISSKYLNWIKSYLNFKFC